jgi:hypothetical protein
MHDAGLFFINWQSFYFNVVYPGIDAIFYIYAIKGNTYEGQKLDVTVARDVTVKFELQQRLFSE